MDIYSKEYRDLHTWVKKNKPKTGRCVDCKKKGFTQWSNVDHQYRWNLDDFIERCPACHAEYDRQFKPKKTIEIQTSPRDVTLPEVSLRQAPMAGDIRIAKACTKCKLTKTLDEFPPDKRNKDGRQGRCLACKRSDHRAWRETNREKYNAQVNAWRKANPKGSTNPDKRLVRCIEYLGGTCECGATDGLEIVHVRDDKSFEIEVGLILPWEMLKDELDKCDLMCPRCIDKKLLV